MSSKIPCIYQKLPPDPGSIRLLRVRPAQKDDVIECELTVGNVNTSEYRALSYVWGSPDETFSIKVNGEPWSVRRSLRSFLRKAQKEHANEPFWIDALCINQDDTLERNQQVAQMSRVYSQATLVLVWLDTDLSSFELFSHFSNEGDWTGPVDYGQELDRQGMNVTFEGRPLHRWEGWEDPDEPASDAIPPFDSSFDSLEPWSASEKETARTVFAELSQYPYWTRSWVVQEFCLAKNILFVFQSMELPFLIFERALLLTEPDENSSTATIKEIGELVFWRQGVYQAVSEESRLEHPIDMQELLITFGLRNCQDIRDRVFSLVGMCEESRDFKVDYRQSKQQLLVAVLQYLHSKGKGRFYTAIRLVELLDLTLPEITSNMDDLPVLDLTHDLASGLFVVNGTGGIARSRQLLLCQCRQCHNLGELFQPTEQVIIVRTPLPSLWLLYLFKEFKICDAAMLGGTEAHFKFLACASPVGDGLRADHKLCAFIPEHPLLKLYYESQLSLKNDGQNAMKIHVNERSVFARAFCASLFGPASAPHLAHSSMTPPVGTGYDSGQLGIVHYEWDWSCPSLNSSDDRMTMNTDL